MTRLRRGRANDWGWRGRSIFIHSGARTPSFRPVSYDWLRACYVRPERPIRSVYMYVAASVGGEAVGNSWSPWEKRTNKFSLTLCLKEGNSSSVFSPLEKPLHIFFSLQHPPRLKGVFPFRRNRYAYSFQNKGFRTSKRKQRMFFSPWKKEMAQVLISTWKNRYAYAFRWLDPTS